MSHTDFRIKINSIYPRCVDGRPAALFIEWQDGVWKVTKRNQTAAAENGPQFLGGSLLFVKALEELAGKSREEAFDLVEEVAERLELGLQVHLDDDHGEYEVADMTDEALVNLIQTHHTGCGFAIYAWGEDGEAVIAEAKDRHWRLQLLVGDHVEKGATINQKDGETFDTAQAAKAEQAQFNIDMPQADKFFEELADLIGQADFAQKAADWTEKTFIAVVIALKGVQTPDEVATIE